MTRVAQVSIISPLLWTTKAKENEEIFVNSIFSEKIGDRYNQQILKYI